MAEENSGLLMGARQIAVFLGQSESAVYGMIKGKKIPIFKIGQKVASRKGDLLAWMESKVKERANA